MIRFALPYFLQETESDVVIGRVSGEGALYRL